MNVLIADDEAPARAELRYILEALLPEAVFSEATYGLQVLELVEAGPLDVIFLDINMPELDGLSVAAALLDGPQPPLVVFATAYDQHALRAFDLAALDYVVKPFSERRLAQTVERLRQALAERGAWEQRQAALRGYLQAALPSGSGLARLWAQRPNENWLLLDYADILWVEAQEKKVYAQTAAEKLEVHHTLKELEPRLAAHQFVRVHKSYLVNLQAVAEIVPWFSGNYLLRMRDPQRTEIPLSRRYAGQLKKLTGWS
ncbi:MAG: LytTR family DNA-binding domain-containing protein [Chloroflexota bacterium]